MLTFPPLGAAMLYFHRMRIAHCDISPENVLITRSNLRIMVIDFGLAVAVNGKGRSAELTTRGVAGKQRYLAPEVRRVCRSRGKLTLGDLAAWSRFFA